MIIFWLVLYDGDSLLKLKLKYDKNMINYDIHIDKI